MESIKNDAIKTHVKKGQKSIPVEDVKKIMSTYANKILDTAVEYIVPDGNPEVAKEKIILLKKVV